MKLNQKTFDLGFGDPVCVRETLCGMYSLPISLIQLKNITYPNPLGDPDLIEKLSSFKDLTGNKNIVLTTGANQAVNLILRILRREGKTTISKNTPSFMYYDDIIDRSGFIRENNWSDSSDVVLLDWPSNPNGLMGSNWKLFQNDYIWDSVYNTPTYINIKVPEPKGWRFKVGGFSKLTGLSGLRIGWIVCRDKKDLDAISYELKYENCGISSVSQLIALDVLKKLDFETFYKLSNTKINLNRDEIQKMSRIFDGQKLPVNGMFYSARANKKSISLMKKAGVNYITMIDGKEPLIRFSLGQNNTLTRDAMRAVLAIDKIGGKK